MQFSGSSWSPQSLWNTWLKISADRLVALATLAAAWLFLLTSIPIFVVAGARHKAGLIGKMRPVLAKDLSAGILSAAAYWVVVWAMSVAPMGLVAALRETSVVLAALIGGILLRERVRWAAVVLVFSGIVLARLA